MQILKYLTEWIILFSQHKCIVEIKIKWNDTKHTFHACWKIIINYFSKKTFSVSEGALLNILKNFSEMKGENRFLVLYSKNYLFVTK